MEGVRKVKDTRR